MFQEEKKKRQKEKEQEKKERTSFSSRRLALSASLPLNGLSDSRFTIIRSTRCRLSGGWQLSQRKGGRIQGEAQLIRTAT